MTYDLIIISQSCGNLIQVTQNCIDSARQDNADLNIIVVETGEYYGYDVDVIAKYEGEFNYNRALNLGLKSARSDFQILANNDIVFHKGWSQIGNYMKEYGYLSASAFSSDIRMQVFREGFWVYEGYEIGRHLAGWCIFTDKSLWDKIGKLNEQFKFWYSDNIYAKQLQDVVIKHALFCNIRVDHLGSMTLAKQSREIQKEYTYSQGRMIKDFKSLCRK